MRQVAALENLVRRLSSHSALSADEIRAILALPGTATSVRSHSDFVRAGDEASSSCLIETGIVARVEVLDDGGRQIVSLHLPGDLVDFHSVWFSRAPASLHAIGPASVVRLPHSALRDLIDRWPGLNAALWRDTVLDAAMVAQAVVRIGRRDAYARIAHLLCDVATRLGYGKGRERFCFPFAITQEQLSDVVGLTSVHVNRTLRLLRESGLCTVGAGRVEVLDWRGLRRVASFDPAYLSMRQYPLAGRDVGSRSIG